ncbi:rhamnulokinase [Nocardioides caldifontis]|uniref:rhamnulokinase n=1 Tax=Nocardioides caldifontis TaxID=2588938 RepID=UPI001EF0E2A0|nr:rhamnulokinase family protein [Nocardioides caldifontis]
MRVSVAAVDLGASSGRVMVGEVSSDHLALRAVARFDNEPLRLPDGLHWDVGELHRQALRGLREAVRVAPDLAGVAVDSWAVDYGLFRGDRLLGLPYHYRDEARAAGVDRVHALVTPEELYERNGLQFLPFNTLYQLAADPVVALADTVLMVPDLIGFWLTEQAFTERTNASTTGLLDVRTREWDRELCARLGIVPDIFPELVDPGTVLGALSGPVASYVGGSFPLTSVGSHDTASAVVGVPMTDDGAAYVSCGTWGLVGVELEEPVLTEAARAANFTNEGGVDGRTRFLTNVMGTWLLSETLRAWGRDDLPALLDQAAAYSGAVTIFNVQDPRFLPPGDMPARVAEWCAEHDVPAPSSDVALVRSIVESLAEGFARAVADAARLSGREVRVVHVVGGGARNELLCQALADRVEVPVVAGPVEATALGNVLLQARTLGALEGSLEGLRSLVAATQELRRYGPTVGERRAR